MVISIQKHIKKNECLLWRGQPCQDLIFNKVDIFYSPMLIFICILLYFLKMQINSKVDLSISSILWYLVLISLFLYGLIGRKFLDRYYRRNITYAVTSDRIFSFYKDQLILEKEIKSLKLNSYNSINKLGFISFGIYISEFDLVNYKNGWPSKEILLKRFEQLPNVQEVFKILQTVQLKLNTVNV